MTTILIHISTVNPITLLTLHCSLLSSYCQPPNQDLCKALICSFMRYLSNNGSAYLLNSVAQKFPSFIDHACNLERKIERKLEKVGLDGSYFAYNDITIDISVEVGIAFDPNKAMLLRMVEPVACSASSNQPLQLIDLDPYQLIHSFVAPNVQALSPKLHGTTWTVSDTVCK